MQWHHIEETNDKIMSLHHKREDYKRIRKPTWSTGAKEVQTFKKKDGNSRGDQIVQGAGQTPLQERLQMKRFEENQCATSLQLSKEAESQTVTLYCTLHRNGMHEYRP